MIADINSVTIPDQWHKEKLCIIKTIYCGVFSFHRLRDEPCNICTITTDIIHTMIAHELNINEKGYRITERTRD